MILIIFFNQNQNHRTEASDKPLNIDHQRRRIGKILWRYARLIKI